jgi:hypothetical protein
MIERCYLEEVSRDRQNKLVFVTLFYVGLLGYQSTKEWILSKIC